MKQIERAGWRLKTLVPVLCSGLMLGAGGALAASHEQGMHEQGMSKSGQGKMSAQRGTGSLAQALPEPYKLSNWIGKSVQNQQGDKLGTVKELVMDDYGIVRYTIMEPEGEDQRLVAIPMAHFKFPLKPRQDLVLNVTPQKMQEAPGFESSAYPNMGDEEWTALVITYWLPPDAAQRMQAQAGQQAQQGSPGSYDGNRDMVYLPEDKEQLFDRLDKDNDAAIERKEARSHERLAEEFDQLDTYANNRLTRSEFAAFELREDAQQGGYGQQKSGQPMQEKQQP